MKLLNVTALFALFVPLIGSDIVVLVLDGVDGVTEQDKKIAGYAYEAGKGVIIVVNKWDLVEKMIKLH